MKKLQRYNMIPNRTPTPDPKSDPIDSENIATALRLAGVAFDEIHVDHTTGEMTIEYDDSIGAPKETTMKNLVKSMPQFLLERV